MAGMAKNDYHDIAAEIMEEPVIDDAESWTTELVSDPTKLAEFIASGRYLTGGHQETSPAMQNITYKDEDGNKATERLEMGKRVRSAPVTGIRLSKVVPEMDYEESEWQPEPLKVTGTAAEEELTEAAEPANDALAGGMGDIAEPDFAAMVSAAQAARDARAAEEPEKADGTPAAAAEEDPARGPYDLATERGAPQLTSMRTANKLIKDMREMIQSGEYSQAEIVEQMTSLQNALIKLGAGGSKASGQPNATMRRAAAQQGMVP